ncbi:MAG: SDR family oxidoreductase [Patulibacter sp.]|nr:SDR family oxidoreductase [Patulibacter sp.]
MNAQRSIVDFGLTDKVGLVIGTGDGMGQATVAALASAGANVACFDLERDAAAAAAKIAEQAGRNALSLTGDATRREDVAHAVDETRRVLGSIDVVVGVVGDGAKKGARLLDTDDDAWNRIVEICTKPAVYAVQSAVGPMIEQGGGGSFVFISSIGGLSGLPGQAPYSAAKAGLMSMVKTLALEYGMEGIRFNAVAPGIIHTPEIDRISTPEHLAVQTKQVPLRRMGRPDDVAKAILFLASDLGGYVTGQTLAVDGGVTGKYQMPAFWAEWEQD